MIFIEISPSIVFFPVYVIPHYTERQFLKYTLQQLRQRICCRVSHVLAQDGQVFLVDAAVAVKVAACYGGQLRESVLDEQLAILQGRLGVLTTGIRPMSMTSVRSTESALILRVFSIG